MKTRLGHDLLGSLEVPADAYYGIHTLRACENFHISGLPIHPELIRSLALVKKACAIANMRTEYLDEKIGNAIIQACDEIAGGKLHDQFIADAFQGGAGTSMNMNANEVIANRAIEIRQLALEKKALHQEAARHHPLPDRNDAPGHRGAGGDGGWVTCPP